MPAIPTVNHISFASVQLGSRDATQERSIPVGAMLGGLAGGAVLTILVTAAWLLWARAMRRSREQREKEATAQKKTKSNTRYNASAALGQPWPEGYRPKLLRPPPETRVKFTEKGWTPSAPKPLRSAKAEQRHHTPARVPRLPSTVSSVSLYSAESAEEHQIRAPTSLILAALGGVEAVLARGSYGDRRPLNRASQATSGSAYSQDVGVAY